MSATELVAEISVLNNDVVTPKPDVNPEDDQQTITVVVMEDTERELTESETLSKPHHQDSKNEAEVNEPKNDSNWQSEARLYCPKNGRPHSVLVDFGYEECPRCAEDLTQPNYISATNVTEASNAEGSDSESRDHEQHTDERKGDLNENDDSPKISFTVEYMDRIGSTVTSEPWVKPFDLQAARGVIGIRKEREPIFEVVTILRTTYSQTRSWETVSGEELLKNPAVGITVWSGKMVIKSPEIIEAIAKVVTYYPFVDLEGETVTINEPYPLIAHHMEQLERYGNRTKSESDTPINNSEDTSAYLNSLLSYVKDSVYKDDISDELARYEQMTCTFRMLWYLFKPGDTVYCETKNSLAAYVVSHVDVDEGILSESTRKSPYTITMWSLDFDGRFVGRCTETAIIPQFEGERAITSLKVFPCKYLDKQDKGQTRQRLEQNGKQWYESIVGRQVYYSGRLAGSRNQSYYGRAYVDSFSYYSENPSSVPMIGEIEDMGAGLPKCYCEECSGQRSHPPRGFRWATYDVLDPFKNRNLETNGLEEHPRHRYLLCNSRFWGLMLKTRTWASLDVANCSTPKANTRAIENLVMPEERKTMIKALVQRFTKDSMKHQGPRPWLADHMENKGEGQIFLLHGGPGVGKTFCIAEYTGRALLSLTGGDIGTDETKVEENLAKWFKLAETWGAVMLIDEADVYLERREFADLKRNSLVSVFLRCTEYYRGILFLTTNRVGTFDDAFMSRIHVVIAYENLRGNDRAKIWKQFFNKLSEDRQDVTVTSRAKRYVLEDENIAELGWNGREIRNAFQTAVALAEYRFQQKTDKAEDEGPVLDQRDFEQVLDMTSQFKEYLVNVHGATADERAYNERSRFAPEEEHTRHNS